MSLLEKYGAIDSTPPIGLAEEIEPGIYLEENYTSPENEDDSIIGKYTKEADLREQFQSAIDPKSFFTPQKSLEKRFESYKKSGEQARKNLGISSDDEAKKRSDEIEKERDRVIGRELPKFLQADPDKKDRIQATARGMGSGFSFGLSKYLEDEPVSDKFKKNYILGEMIGASLPITGVHKLIGTPLGKFASNKGLSNFASQFIEGGSTFGGYEAIKDALQGEFNPLKITGATAAGGVIGTLPTTVPYIWNKSKQFINWAKQLKPQQQSKLLSEGVIGADLTDGQYKFFETRVLPEMENIAKQEFEQAHKGAIESAETEYQQATANAKAKHQAEVSEQAFKGRESLSPESQTVLDETLSDLKAGFDRDMATIEESYKLGLEEFERAQEAIQLNSQRQQIVENIIDPAEGLGQGENGLVTIRPPIASDSTESALYEISPNRVSNTAEAGETLTNVIRANDAADYEIVNNAYDNSRTLNEGIQTTHAELADELLNTIREVESIPAPSPPQNQLRTTAQRLLDNLVVMNEEGFIDGYLEMTNQQLLEQARSLSYSMDFTFAHANTKGIFSPTLTNINNAVESAALRAGQREAFEANQNARQLYREWTDRYQNDYIRPFRDRGNRDFSKNFKKVTSDIDYFPVVEEILETSQAGNQFSNTLKRDLVENKLGKFLKDPANTSLSEFNREIDNIRHLLSPEEIQGLRQGYMRDRSNLLPSSRVKELEKVKKPVRYQPKSVTIPSKKLQDAIKKEGVTVEGLIKETNTPSGLRKLKNRLSEDVFEEVGKRKIRSMLYEGKVKPDFKGNELYRAMNQENNYDILEELLGTETTQELLNASKKISNNKITKDRLLGLGLTASKIKTLVLFGIL